MASDLELVQYVCEQMRGALPISYRKMFGEYAIYCNGKVIALVCDNPLFVQPTDSGRFLIGADAVEAPPYPGARPYLLIGDELDDRQSMSNLIRTTGRALPPPKPKKRKPAGTKRSKSGIVQ